MKNMKLTTAALCMCLAFCAAAVAQDSKSKLTVGKPTRTPIAAFKNGFTLDQAKKFKSGWQLPKLLSGGDNSVWFFFRASEALPTAILPPRQPVRKLPNAYNSAIGKIKAETKRGQSWSRSTQGTGCKIDAFKCGRKEAQMGGDHSVALDIVENLVSAVALEH